MQDTLAKAFPFPPKPASSILPNPQRHPNPKSANLHTVHLATLGIP